MAAHGSKRVAIRATHPWLLNAFGSRVDIQCGGAVAIGPTGEEAQRLLTGGFPGSSKLLVEFDFADDVMPHTFRSAGVPANVVCGAPRRNSSLRVESSPTRSDSGLS
jgi:hypothetical protein